MLCHENALQLVVNALSQFQPVVPRCQCVVFHCSPVVDRSQHIVLRCQIVVDAFDFIMKVAKTSLTIYIM